MNEYILPKLTERDLNLPLYVTSIGHWENQEAMQRPEGFPSHHWLHVISGEGRLQLNSEVFAVKEGQGFFLHPHTPHKYEAVREPWEVQFITFEGSLADSILSMAGISESGVYTMTSAEALIEQIRNMITTLQSFRAYKGLECSKLLYSFLLDMTRYIGTDNQIELSHQTRIQPVIDYIEENFHKIITLDDLARVIQVTPQYLCLLFKLTAKLRPMEYVNRERIHRSKELMLRESERKLHEIAKAVGFEHPSYFSSVFRRLEGKSPAQFMKLHGLR